MTIYDGLSLLTVSTSLPLNHIPNTSEHIRTYVSSKFKILEVSNRRCLQHKVSETIPSQTLLFVCSNLVNEANVEGFQSQFSLSTLFFSKYILTRRLDRQKLQEMQTKCAE